MTVLLIFLKSLISSCSQHASEFRLRIELLSILTVPRRQGSGKTVLLADISERTLETAAEALRATGHNVTTQRVDVSSRELVHALVTASAELGSVAQVITTAGLSPVQATPKAILAVDLYGVALVIEEFGRVSAPGGARHCHLEHGRGGRPPLPGDDQNIRC